MVENVLLYVNQISNKTVKILHDFLMKLLFNIMHENLGKYNNKTQHKILPKRNIHDKFYNFGR